MLIFQIERIISGEKWFNYAASFFFSKMPKIWVGRTTVNREKKRMAYQELSTFDKMSRIKKGNERHNKCRKLK